MKSRLILFPAPLSDNAYDTMPRYFGSELRKISHLICERGKTARAQIKSIDPEFELSSIEYIEFPKNAKPKDLKFIFDMLDRGLIMGFMSEAGLPAVADPGEHIVAYCHQRGYEVHPLVGPSSLFMALMASGLNGQRFRFAGYLAINSGKLISDLKHLVSLANKGESQIFMETPYRNNQLIETLLQNLPSSMKLCIASDITGDQEMIQTKTVAEWKKSPKLDLHKIPTIYIIGH